MNSRKLPATAVLILALAACGKRAEPPPPVPAPAEEPATRPAAVMEPATFIGRTWQVAESAQFARGSLRVFLPDGTLAMSDPGAAPAFGSWRYADGRLTIVEAGREYPTEILELSDRAFRIRMHGPGDPVEVRFVPAPQEFPAAAASAEPPVAGASPTAESLLGTAWQLEDLAGAGVVDRVQATLEFPEPGRAGGLGSCNRFNGAVTIEGDTIRFAGIAATRRACPEAVMRQETAYFAALQAAERFEREGETLRIHALDRPSPLRFTAIAATTAPPANADARVPSGDDAALAGIWTVVAHHHSPGISALTDEEANKRHGETIRLTARSAIAPGNTCREPRYTTSQVPVAAYLASAFNIAPARLPPLAGHNQMRVMEVSCGDADWTELGGLLLEVDRDRALAPWDGVFFVLARDRDFRGLGQEPGWQIELRKGLEMRFSYDYGKGTAATPAPRPRVDAKTGTQTFHAKTGANDLRLDIVPVRCEDSMSGKPYPTTATVTLNGRTFRGCGEHLATPFR
jgi:heat shock protein HslJ